MNECSRDNDTGAEILGEEESPLRDTNAAVSSSIDRKEGS